MKETRKINAQDEFMGQVIDCLEDVMTEICRSNEGLVDGDPEQITFIAGDLYDQIAGEVSYVINRHRLDAEAITSEEALKEAINVIFRPFLMNLSERGWEEYFYPWQRYEAFDKVKAVFESWNLVKIPEKEWMLKIAYSWGDEESDLRFSTEKEAWEEAKRLAMTEIQTTIDEGSDADLKFYGGQMHIELHYYKDDSWCYYDVVKE